MSGCYAAMWPSSTDIPTIIVTCPRAKSMGGIQISSISENHWQPVYRRKSDGKNERNDCNRACIK